MVVIRATILPRNMTDRNKLRVQWDYMVYRARLKQPRDTTHLYNEARLKQHMIHYTPLEWSKTKTSHETLHTFIMQQD